MNPVTRHGTSPGIVLAGMVSALLVIGALVPVLYASYGIYDAVRMAHDFGWMGESRLMDIIMGGGRFLYAWLAKWGFSHTPFIGDLWLLRLVGVAGLAVTALAIGRVAARNGWGLWGAVCLALLATLNPGSTVYGFWSACFPYGFAMLAAFAAGLLWDRPGWSGRLLSLVLMQVSMAVYQPAALYFLAGPFIRWFGGSRESVRPFRALWSAAGILIGMLFHLVLVRAILGLLPDVPDQGWRLTDGSVLESLRHVFGPVLLRLLEGWGNLLPGPWGVALAVFFTTGIVLFLLQSRGPGDRILRLFTLVPVLLCLVPAAVSADGYSPYRLLAPAYTAITFTSLAGFHQWLAGTAFGSRIIPALLALLTTGFAAYAIRFGITEPRERERGVILEALVEAGPDAPPEGMTVIRPEGTYPINKHILQKAEYGAYELSYGGFSEAFMALLAAEAYGWPPRETYPLNKVHWIFYPGDTRSVPVFYPVLDLRQRLQGQPVAPLQADQGTAATHPHLGKCLFFEPGLYLHPKLGLIQQEADRWFFKPGYGWMRWESEPGETTLKARDVEGHPHLFTLSAK